MKKAGQYFKDACNKHEADQKRLKKDLYDEDYFVEAIKQAQIDAIDATIEKCFNDSVIMVYAPYFINQIKAGLDKSKIIELANKLKEEL